MEKRIEELTEALKDLEFKLSKVKDKTKRGLVFNYINLHYDKALEMLEILLNDEMLSEENMGNMYCRILKQPSIGPKRDQMIELLLTKMPIEKKNCRVGNDVYSPLQIAIMFEDYKWVTLLLEKGASTINIQPPLLMMAFIHNVRDNQSKKSVIDLLILKGANVNEKYNGTTILHVAFEKSLWYEQWDDVVTLMDNGADINALDEKNKTPLMLQSIFWSDFFKINLIKYLSRLNEYTLSKRNMKYLDKLNLRDQFDSCKNELGIIRDVKLPSAVDLYEFIFVRDYKDDEFIALLMHSEDQEKMNREIKDLNIIHYKDETMTFLNALIKNQKIYDAEFKKSKFIVQNMPTVSLAQKTIYLAVMDKLNPYR